MNSYTLTERQLQILASLRDKAAEGKKQLLEDAINNKLAISDIEALCRILNDEFLMNGILDKNYTPNEYGHELEVLLDIINRPRLQ